MVGANLTGVALALFGLQLACAGIVLVLSFRGAVSQPVRSPAPV
jgi:hypothetical protein